MIYKFRPRRGQMYIEPNNNGRHTTPLGSNITHKHQFYKHTIPSGLMNDNQLDRPRRGQMYIEPNDNGRHTTPLGSNIVMKINPINIQSLRD
jgi:hypothetical protein